MMQALPTGIRIVTIIAVAAGAAWIGASRAHHVAYASETSDAFIHRGAWFTSRYAGSPDADMRTRALIAATGLLANPRTEAIYFRAHHDDDGRPISSEYEYIIEGPPPKARWWSLTLYDGDNFMNRDASGPYSVKGTQIEPEEDGSVRIVLSSKPHEKNWIDMGTGQNMSLSIRAYNPDPSLIEHLETAEFLSIRRISE